jgi:hypothetical protein
MIGAKKNAPGDISIVSCAVLPSRLLMVEVAQTLSVWMFAALSWKIAGPIAGSSNFLSRPFELKLRTAAAHPRVCSSRRLPGTPLDKLHRI